MKVNQFLFMGNMRSFWDFYRGLGLGATISLTAEGILFWQLSYLAKTDAKRLRPILATFAVAYTVLAVNSFTYFFLAPVMWSWSWRSSSCWQLLRLNPMLRWPRRGTKEAGTRD